MGFDNTAVEAFSEMLSMLPVSNKRSTIREVVDSLTKSRSNIIAIYRFCHKAVAKGESVNLCGELLLDEFYSVEKQLMLAMRFVSEGKKMRLPCISSGESFGRCRAFAIAQRIVRLEKGILDTASIAAFIMILQNKQSLLHEELCIMKDAVRVELINELSNVLKNFGALSNDDYVCMQRIILSLKAIDDESWDEYVEDLSNLNVMLKRDVNFYKMDKESREYCLKKVLRISKKLRLSEIEVARGAVELAASGKGKEAHAAWYLTAEGEEQLCNVLRPNRIKGIGYGEWKTIEISGIIAGTLFILAAFLFATPSEEKIGTLILGIYPACVISISIITTVLGKLSKPRCVVRLASEHMDTDSCTAVAVPVLLTSEECVEDAVRTLETHYVANNIETVCFILLGDLPDSNTKDIKGDEELIRRAKDGIELLNKKYGERFFFLCRERKDNGEGVFRGFERKRGAVMQLCELLSVGRSEFQVVYPYTPNNCKYLTVLDSDTVLPMDSLEKLIGAAEHPINQPETDENGSIISGYTIFAPNMRATAKSAAKSFFARLVSGDSGTSTYSTNISNMHMDMYGEGDFGGKGIINIKSFLAALKGKIPENAVLSHDLLEGGIARTAFLNDVTLYDGEPSTYMKWWKRQHRWIRGDWQLLPFIFGRKSKIVPNLIKLRMIGNLIRSMREPITVVLLALSCLFGLPRLLALTFFAFLFEPIKGFILLCLSSFEEKADMQMWKLLVIRTAVEIVALPYSAYKAADAIIRTVIRLFITKRNLLEWQTAASTAQSAKTPLEYVKAMVICPVSAIILVGLCGIVNFFIPSNISISIRTVCFILSVVWLASPVVIRAIDRERREYQMTKEEKTELLTLSSGIWQFFGENCNEKTSFLPPDNVQEKPKKPPVGITSPTNIGMGMLAIISAYDIGLISEDCMVIRLDKMVSSIERMEKWHGNLYNWYRVSDLSLLHPRFISSVDSGNLVASMMVVMASLDEFGDRYAKLRERVNTLIKNTDLSALYDKRRKLFYIGYEYDEGRYTSSRYDLYASEARLTGFVAIALGQIGKEHWQKLSRVMTEAEGGMTLLSWSGTAFEYLMPLIFFDTAEGSLQYEICKSAMRTQMLKGTRKKPWGVSESGYYCFDKAMYYQYRAFGVAGLGLEPRREKTDVIAPYATALALSVEKEAALQNIKLIKQLGACGRYGMYEALDYSAGICGGFEMVRSFMAHHQGMSICAFNNALNNNILIKRFMNIPCVRAGETLLFESMPTKPLVMREYESSVYKEYKKRDAFNYIRKFEHELGCQLLSNGSYSTLVLSNGGGWSKFENVMVTRWRHAFVTEPEHGGGIITLIKSGGNVWSCNKKSVFESHKATFLGSNGGIEGRCSVIVSAERNAEVRRVKLINHSRHSEQVRIGFFLEPSLVGQREDEAHPAFVKLSIEAKKEDEYILFHIRPKEGREERWLYIAAVTQKQFEICTDSYTCPGRLRSPADAMNSSLKAEFNERPIEPYYSAMVDIDVKNGCAAEASLIVGVADSEEEAAEAVRDLRRNIEREEAMSMAITQGMRKTADITSREAYETEQLLTRIVCSEKFMSRHSKPGKRGVEALWELGISGDIPIITVSIDNVANLPGIKKLAAFTRYSKLRRMDFDVVIIGKYPYEYYNRLRVELSNTVATCMNIRLIDIYSITEEQLKVLENNSLIYCDVENIPYSPLKMAVRRNDANVKRPTYVKPKRHELKRYNGYGGFDEKNNEYVIYCGENNTPAPWCNIIANERFGTLVTESGGGFTWYDNPRLKRITPWTNDPFRDPKTERISIIDVDGSTDVEIPPRNWMPYVVAHGIGYSRYSVLFDSLEAELVVTVDSEQPIKYCRLRLKNCSDTVKKVRASLAVDWAMGETYDRWSVYTEKKKSVIMARSVRVDSDDRYGFITAGKEGYVKDDNTVEREVTIEKGKIAEIVFLIGCDTEDNIGAHLDKKANSKAFYGALEDNGSLWDARLGGIKVKTGDGAFDALVNGLLLYQTYSSRLLGRTGFYQSGGAYGFRDQLQDVSALLMTDPERARKQILLAASKQFEKGDVLHWWHDNGRGVRTRMSDDRIFLPYTVMCYAEVTGDDKIWDEQVSYLEDLCIPDGAEDLYTFFAAKGEDSIFMHCVRAIESTSNFGVHGLPLMGTGDWNDGMDNVGKDGGESVWLGWFLLYVLERFACICEKRGEIGLLAEYEKRANRLRSSSEKNGWDGEWYRRAYYGDGMPLGSANSSECRIDCIAQSWAIFCNAKHSKEAFEAICSKLVDYENAVVRLLVPPFSNKGVHKAGYIESYVEGVRENGGQYTHAAAWAVIAAAMLGEGEKAQMLFKLINPIEHGDAMNINRYRIEPYSVAGDVYSVGRNAGRGGWSWYTGAAAWMYRAAVEYILGIRKKGNTLTVSPVTAFESFDVEYRFGKTKYKINAKRGEAEHLALDGKSVEIIELKDDGKLHTVQVVYR